MKFYEVEEILKIRCNHIWEEFDITDYNAFNPDIRKCRICKTVQERKGDTWHTISRKQFLSYKYSGRPIDERIDFGC